MTSHSIWLPKPSRAVLRGSCHGGVSAMCGHYACCGRSRLTIGTDVPISTHVMSTAQHARISWICRTGFERERFLDMHRRLLPINARLLVLLVVMILPFYGVYDEAHAA